MTRRLLAFFVPGMLMAQTKLELNGNRIVSIAHTPRIPRPENGECPIPGCGWKAEPHVIPIGPYSWEKSNHSRRIDCAHCGCTFRQWAEGKEPANAK